MAEIKLEISGPGSEVALELAKGGRGALRRAFGGALTEFGNMLSDQMRYWRLTNILRIREKVDRLANEHQVPDALFQALPFGDAMRTLEAASQEDEPDVQELWAGLIVRAASSDRPAINKLHIELLRSITPVDASLLEVLYPSIAGMSFASRKEIEEFNEKVSAKAEEKWHKFSEDDRAISIQNLIRLRCITATPRSIDANGLLQLFSDRARGVSGGLVDPRQFEKFMAQLIERIYQAAGAIPYDAHSPVTIYRKGAFGVSQVGELNVPELSYMLTPMGAEFMKAVTLDKSR